MTRIPGGRMQSSTDSLTMVGIPTCTVYLQVEIYAPRAVTDRRAARAEESHGARAADT